MQLLLKFGVSFGMRWYSSAGEWWYDGFCVPLVRHTLEGACDDSSGLCWCIPAGAAGYLHANQGNAAHLFATA
ncbi:hypothetical protein SKAU_G00326860 [Synaphobranchus kaupii]|uniref:Uncharacterized protein n=1 Tax=Synaphobranchus kaupii TaxID=118154 RepID=A0A9Q1EPR7_SYNKA|nr:hypothetical protein SKAU_G00326860 [Synaphobranchus kaupii]